MAKLLVIEDEQDLSDLVRTWLERESHTVEVVQNGADALEYLRLYKYDLIILDLMLPGLGGMEICRQYRVTGGTTPILMLTAKGAVDDKEAGLDAGADDYVTKPFALKELSARVRALLRRPEVTKGTVLTTKDLELDTQACRVKKSGQELRLLPKEYSLLEFFMRHPNQVFSAEALLERVWASDTEVFTDTVRTYIKTLRKKIDTPDHPSLISTIHGIGYKLEDG